MKALIMSKTRTLLLISFLLINSSSLGNDDAERTIVNVASTDLREALNRPRPNHCRPNRCRQVIEAVTFFTILPATLTLAVLSSRTTSP